MSKTAAIIVTYNRKHKLRSCAEAVLAQDSSERADIFIVDNGSSDGTEEMVSELAQSVAPCDRGRINYTNLRHNSGGAGGFCYGIRKAVEAGYDYVWLMDDDSVPQSDALEEFVRYDREHRGEYGFLTGRVLWTDGTPCVMNIQRRTLTRKVRVFDAGPVRVAMASFVSLFIPSEVVRDVGLPIREFFIWTDDWEYTRRISRRYPCMLIPSSVTVHDTPKNEKADIAGADAERLGRFRYLYRNDVYLYRREGLKGFCYEAARLSMHLCRIAAGKYDAAEKLRRAGIVIGGTAEGLRFNPVPERVMPKEDR